MIGELVDDAYWPGGGVVQSIHVFNDLMKLT